MTGDGLDVDVRPGARASDSRDRYPARTARSRRSPGRSRRRPWSGAGSRPAPGATRRGPGRGAPARADRTGAPAGAGSRPSTSGSRAGPAHRGRSPCPSGCHRSSAASLHSVRYGAPMGTRTTTRRMTDGRAGLPSAAADEGLYGPASEAWRLNREAMLLLGAGPRALLLQLAHPAVAAGVADHSDFRTDPWRRLAGTLRSYLTIVYGTTAAARAEIRRLNALHRGITGPGYSARDPDLSLWVHATLVESTIAVVRRLARAARRPPAARPTTPRRDRSAGRSACRRRACPRTSRRSSDTSRRCSARPGRSTPRRWRASWPGSCFGRRSPRWRPCCRSRTAQAVAVLRRIPAGAYAWTLWPSVGLLPPSVREDYGLSWGPVERTVSAWLVAGWRGWRPLLPAGFRQMAKARAADRRVAAGRRSTPTRSRSAVSRSAGSAARTASARDRARSRRRARGAASRS